MTVGLFGHRFSLGRSHVRPLSTVHGLLPVQPRAATPVFVSAQNGVWNPNSNPVPKPLGLKLGDWVFAVFVLHTAYDTITSAPSGWILIVSSPYVWIYKKRASAEEPPTYSFGASSSSFTGYTFAIRGPELGVTRHNFNSMVSQPAEPEVRSGQIHVRAGRLLFAVLGIRNNGANMLSGPAGMTQRATQFTDATPRGAIFSQPILTSGVSGNKVFRVEEGYHSIAGLFEVG